MTQWPTDLGAVYRAAVSSIYTSYDPKDTSENAKQPHICQLASEKNDSLGLRDFPILNGIFLKKKKKKKDKKLSRDADKLIDVGSLLFGFPWAAQW